MFYQQWKLWLDMFQQQIPPVCFFHLKNDDRDFQKNQIKSTPGRCPWQSALDPIEVHKFNDMGNNSKNL